MHDVRTQAAIVTVEMDGPDRALEGENRHLNALPGIVRPANPATSEQSDYPALVSDVRVVAHVASIEGLRTTSCCTCTDKRRSGWLCVTPTQPA